MHSLLILGGFFTKARVPAATARGGHLGRVLFPEKMSLIARFGWLGTALVFDDKFEVAGFKDR
jgi:hypothetical protein